MATGYLNSGSVFTDGFLRLRNEINTAMSGTTVNGVYSTFPDVGRRGFAGFPLMTISLPDLSESNITFGNGLKDGTVEYIITAYAKKMADIGSVSNHLYQTMNAYELKSGTDALGLMNRRLVSSPTVTSVIGKDKIHTKNFRVRFDYRYA